MPGVSMGQPVGPRAKPGARPRNILELTSSLRAKPLIARSIDSLDWPALATGLDATGCAVLPHLLTPAACRDLADLYSADEPFRSRVVMSRHGFGRGEYKYFAYPLPPLV